jgi:hypothetical protein
VKNWRSGLAVVLVFLLGVAAGGFGALVWIKKNRALPFVERRGRAENEAGGFLARKLTRDLDLDPQQQADLRRILGDAARDMREIRREIGPRTRNIIERSDEQIRAILRPDQQSRFDDFLRKRRDQWTERRPREHPPGAEAPPPGHLPPPPPD